ncbi:MAG: S8 family serine peptidase [Anaerolineae bacterium]
MRASSCVAAGNMGPSGHTIAPSAAKRVLTIGASESHPGDIADWGRLSSRGPTGDGSAKPDLIFPGDGIVSARAAGTSLGRPVDERYTALRGTSQATPFATGTVALLLSANPRLAPDDVRERLVRGAQRLPGVDPLAQGAGRGNAYNAFVNALGAPIGQSGGAPGAPALPEPTASAPDRPAGCLPAAMGVFRG